MQNNFTKEDVILYAYGEMQGDLAGQMAAHLKTDNELSRYYRELTGLKSGLDSAAYEPNASSIERIMEHSDKLSKKRFQLF